MNIKKWTLIILLAFFVVSISLYLFLGTRVSGVVLTRDTNEPIPYASITINDVSTMCNEEGSFSRWFPPFSEKKIVVDHPCFDRFVKHLKGFDLSKDIEIKLNNSSYETLITTCQDQLQILTHFVSLAESISYSYPEDNTPIANKIETLFIATPVAQLYSQDASNTKEGNLDVGHRTIVIGADPGKLGQISYLSGVPQIYYKGDRTDWITFNPSEDLDFEIALVGSKNPKKMLEPLYSYGNTGVFELLKNPGTTNDGVALTGCKTSWDPEGPLRGKSITFLFKKTGEWYDIIFEDTGENPLSTQGLYHFSCLETGSHIEVAIPENAEHMTPRQLIEKYNEED